MTNYIGAARTEYLDDLDNSNSSIFVDELNNTSTMNIIGETPGWHYANNPWKLGGQLHEPGKPVYSFSFIDEHAKNLKIYGGMGINSENETLNFRNF